MLEHRFALEFSRRPRVAAVAWILISAGVTAAAGSAVFLREAWLQRAQLLEQRERITRAVAREAENAAGPALNASARGVVESARTDAVRVWGDLQRPWADLLDHLQTVAQPPVRLLQVGVDGRFSELQLQAEARTLDDVFRLAEALQMKAPVVSARLTSHEWRTTGSGQRIVTARVRAVLSETAAEAPRAAATPEARLAARQAEATD